MRQSRREFLKKAGAVGGLALTGVLSGCGRQAATSTTSANPKLKPDKFVAIVADPTDPVASSQPAQWAIGQLVDAMSRRGIRSQIVGNIKQAAEADRCIVVGGPGSQSSIAVADVPESVAINSSESGSQKLLSVTGRDARGLSYGITELADRFEHTDSPGLELQSVPAISEQPANSIRSVMRLFASELEDKPWFYDRDQWQRYFDMLASQRFNRFNLALGLEYDSAEGIVDSYFLFAYPFLLAVPGFNVKARGLADEERDKNLDTLKFISDEAAKRGLHFQLGIWLHAYEWLRSPNVNYVIDGLNTDNQGSYCKDAIRTLLTTCPNISGVTFRTHGESGVAEGNYGFWRGIWDGMAAVGRPIEIDLHAKGLDSNLIDNALATGMPVIVTPKYWAEHLGLPYCQAAIRENEMPKGGPDRGFSSLSAGSRSFMRYGYGDLFTRDRKFKIVYRIWPGTQRLLLWADPVFAADYGRNFSFCGSDGFELMEPLTYKGRKGTGTGKGSGRTAYADAAMRPQGGDWEKYIYTFRLWGRLTFNPDSKAEVYERYWHHRNLPMLKNALGYASRILPLVTTAHSPSAANANFWPEIYTNMSFIDARNPGPYTDMAGTRVFGHVTALDPQMFSSVEEYVDSLLSNKPIAKISPLEVARQLDECADAANAELKQFGDAPSRGQDEWTIYMDASILAALGTYFSAKFRAAVLFVLFDRTGYEPARQACLKMYRKCSENWKVAVKAGQDYLPDITFGPEQWLRGNWSDRLAAIDRDIALVEAYAPGVQRNVIPESRLAAIVANEGNGEPRPNPHALFDHTMPKGFTPGQSLTLDFAPIEGNVPFARLAYRHVNQAEHWQYAKVAQQPDGNILRAEIAGAYTNSPYPLQYYLEFSDASTAGMYPGFQKDFRGQPYFVVNAATA